jgi:hypothetical protein
MVAAGCILMVGQRVPLWRLVHPVPNIQHPNIPTSQHPNVAVGTRQRSRGYEGEGAQQTGTGTGEHVYGTSTGIRM